MAKKATKDANSKVRELREKRRAAKAKKSAPSVAEEAAKLELLLLQKELEAEKERLERRAARKIRAATQGIDDNVLRRIETNRGTIAQLMKAEKAQPAYERGSFRQQVRLPVDWKIAVSDAAEAKGMTVSAFIRMAIYKQLPADVRKELPAVRMGRGD